MLCPGINDGDELRYSIEQLSALYPSVQSIAAVPVGLTKFRDGLEKLEPYNKQTAGEVIDIIEEYSAKFRCEYGTGLCYPADEFFIKAERELPSAYYYDDYQPTMMMGASNDFYNYILEMYTTFAAEEGVTLKSAWESYKNYCDDARVTFPLSQRLFKEEMRNYFEEYLDRFTLMDGTRVRSFFRAFKVDKMEDSVRVIKKPVETSVRKIDFNSTVSIFDTECADCPSQYATDEGRPMKKWANVTTKLSDISTDKLHYVKVPDNHIVIDFVITDETGNKSFESNL